MVFRFLIPLSLHFFIPSLFLHSFISAQTAWVQKSSLPAPGRITAVAFTIGDKGYFGLGNSLNDFWGYNPQSDSWMQKADYPGSSQGYAAGFAIGSKGYAGTGKNGNNFLSDFWEFDPLTNIWSPKNDLAGSGRATAVAFSVNGKGYIGAGSAVTNTCTSDFWEYDPATDSWTQMADFPAGPRCDIDRAVFVINGKAYLGTGYDYTYSYNDFWEFFPDSNSWKQKNSFPGPPRFGAVGFSICNTGFLGLGKEETIAYDDFWAYNPVTDTWVQVDSFPGEPRVDLPSFVVNNKAYIGTGWDGTTYFNDLWEFTYFFFNVSITKQDINLCGGNDGAATISATGGVAPYGYLWSDGQTDSTATGLLPGNYSVTITDQNGCSQVQDVTINNPSGLAVNFLKQDISCSDADDGTIAALTTGGISPFFYFWNTSDTTSSLTGLQPGNYSVTVTDSLNCVYNLSVILTEPPALQITVSGTNATCNSLGTAAVMFVSGGTPPYDYVWSNGSTNSVAVAGGSGSYTVTVTDGNGCVISDSINIIQTSSVTGIITGVIEVCTGDTVNLIASGGGSYQWSDGTANDTLTTILFSPAMYSVIITDGVCADTAIHSVDVTDIAVDAGNDTTILIGSTATLHGLVTGDSPPFMVVWKPGGFTTEDITISPESSTFLIVRATDSKGCTATDTILVDVKLCGNEIFIPNAFSPDCNCPDETFSIYSDCLTAVEIIIFNRWGEIVYQYMDAPLHIWGGAGGGVGWNGNYKGNDLDAGVFVYRVKYKTINEPGTEKRITGNVNLIR
ncbi:MAG: gliding motility-associated C-terminal domain-containing protein [Bacteroidetes bacterium]|nr:gliding motility-associated C-terminal domain-containing protein [Bacteroidota bacterium]